MSFPRYPNYKDSGVEWLGEVPGHWEVWKLAHAFALVGSGTTPKTDNRKYYDDGDIPWVNTGDLNDGELDDCEKRITAHALAEHTSLKIYPAGSLLIAMYGATIGKLAMLRFPSTVNQACCVFAGKSEIAPKFMFYWFLGLRQQILSLATGGGQPNISQDILRTLRVACPGIPEQTQIATFLDRETAKIDELVAEQRRLMELLKEKRQAVISHAVTQGLNPHTPMKPSGIEWLGDVPEHWEVGPVKRLIEKVESGTSVNATDEPAEEGKLGVLKTSCVYSGRFEPHENKTVVEDEVHRVSCPLRDGTLIVSRMNTPELIGASGLVIDAPPNLFLPDRLWQISFSTANPRFIHFWTLCSLYRAQVKTVCAGTSSSMKSLGQEQFGNFAIATPPTEEQAAISDFLDQEIAKFDTLTAEAQRAIDLLQERRTALISAAVTGQIDVRRHASVGRNSVDESSSA